MTCDLPVLLTFWDLPAGKAGPKAGKKGVGVFLNRHPEHKKRIEGMDSNGH